MLIVLPLETPPNFLTKWGGMFSADNHMAAIIERTHNSASLNTNPTKSFVTAANRRCLLSAAWVQVKRVCAAEGFVWQMGDLSNGPKGHKDLDLGAYMWVQYAVTCKLKI